MYVSSWLQIHRAALAALLIVLAAIDTADAAVTTGTSNAFGEQVNMSIFDFSLSPSLGLFTAISGPSPFASWNAPPAGAVIDGALSVTVGNPHPFLTGQNLLMTGVTEVRAQSTVNGGSGPRSADAKSEVTNTAFDSNFPAFHISLLARQVQSTAAVTGDTGTLAALGTTTLINAILAIESNTLGSPYLLALDSSPAPNTVIDVASLINSLPYDPLLSDPPFYPAGITIFLNEQTEVAGTNSLSLAVNAIRLHFDDFTIPGLLNSVRFNGDIIIGHSEASLITDSASGTVPEPASLAIWGLGALGCAFGGYRRRRPAAV